MIEGSGMLARAFAAPLGGARDIIVYAAGVSNSRCTDKREFERERERICIALRKHAVSDRFLYFSTCSVADPESIDTEYVQHKLRMEALVRGHADHLIFRLPQVAGRTPNPNTLLNYLHARIVRAERFRVWMRARRNIIDVDDVVALVSAFLANGTRGATINLANERDISLPEIVRTFEHVTGSKAVYDEVDRGGQYPIDVRLQRSVAADAGVSFDDDYVERVIRKYYG